MPLATALLLGSLDADLARGHERPPADALAGLAQHPPGPARPHVLWPERECATLRRSIFVERTHQFARLGFAIEEHAVVFDGSVWLDERCFPERPPCRSVVGIPLIEILVGDP